MNRREALIIGMIGFVFAGTAVLAENAPSSAAGNGAQTYLCHATGSPKNPYVMIKLRTDDLSAARNAHLTKHTGPLGPTEPGHWGDIVPPVPGLTEGQNFDFDGEQVWLNGCDPVEPAPSPSTTAAVTTTTMAQEVTITTVMHETVAVPRP